MLDKTSKQVFGIISRELKNKNGFLWFSEIYEMAEKELGITEYDAMGCVNYLHDKGYIKYAESKGRNVGLYLAHRGNHTEEFKWIDFKLFLKQNVIAIIALVVSIAAFIKSFFF